MSGPLLLKLPWASPRLAGFTSTRVGGRSRGAYDSLNLGLNTGDDAETVAWNRRAALERAGLDPARTVYARQAHGSNIVEAGLRQPGQASRPSDQGLPECDALFTRVAGLPLAVGHADCLAVAVADPEAGLLGLAHAGWRGALAALPGKLVRRLIAEGASAQRLRAVLSPCLGPASLQLGEEQHRLFSSAFERSGDFCGALSHGHFYLDLWACARRQLLEAGMDALKVQEQGLDTAQNPELFYSYRRDKVDTGRMMTVAALV